MMTWQQQEQTHLCQRQFKPVSYDTISQLTTKLLRHEGPVYGISAQQFHDALRVRGLHHAPAHGDDGLGGEARAADQGGVAPGERPMAGLDPGHREARAADARVRLRAGPGKAFAVPIRLDERAQQALD